MRYLLLFFLLFPIFLFANNQIKIDSLKQLLPNAKSGGKTFILCELSTLYSLDNNGEKALQLANEALILSKQTSNKKGEAMAVSSIALAYFYLNKTEKAKDYFLKSIDMFSALKDFYHQTIDLHILALMYYRDIKYQKTNIMFIKTKLYTLDEKDTLLNLLVSSADSVEQLALFSKAENYIIQSRPDEGIPLIFEFLKTVDEISDSAIYAKIYLAEAYREKEEHLKGMKMIYRLLEEKNISNKNKAFAYNRLAALYNEYEALPESRIDSVIKYSNLCIKISKENNFIKYTAASQNELAFVYRHQNQDQLSIDFGLKAYNNFIKSKAYPEAMNTAINLAYTYKNMGKPQIAENFVYQALEDCPIKGNKNLFISIYRVLGRINVRLHNYEKAYEYLDIAHNLQKSFYYERMSLQINEMSAKYEIEKKENENLFLKKENKIKDLTISRKNLYITSLITGVILIVVFLILIYMQYRKKDSAYKILVQQSVENAKCDRKQWQLHETQDGDEKTDFTDSDENMYEHLINRLQQYFVEEKPYLHSRLNLDDLCKALNTNRSYLSKTLNDHLNLSFYELVNDYRLKEARLLLMDKQYNHISIAGIGQMAGFASRSTFYSGFNKQFGISPSYFRDSLKK